MGSIVLDNIPFRIDCDELFRSLRVYDGSEDAEELRALVHDAESIARPKALYRVSFIDSKEEDSVVVDGFRFTSRVLRINLDKTYRVFAYVATCGRELEDWAEAIDDPLRRYWVDKIMEMALRTATAFLDAHIDDNYQPGQTSVMNPGSFKDWPLSEQKVLFALLGNPKNLIGVELRDSCLMVPIKSVSGIRFPSDTDYHNCRLCARSNCPGRRVPYDRELHEKKYHSID